MPTRSTKSGDLFTRAVTARQLSRYAAALVTFIVATVTAFAAQDADMPRTAAVVCLVGVTLVGGMVGLRGGLAAAFLASLIYNFFLSDPVFRFSLTSPEEYVPLIAFNLGAATSALLAGRLKDRAFAAELASRRMRALFNVSQRLQGAVRLEEIPAAIMGFGEEEEGWRPELYVLQDGRTVPLQIGSHEVHLADELIASGENGLIRGDRRALALSTPDGPAGVVILPWSARAMRREEEHDVEAFVNLLSITLERCLLLQQRADAELIRRSEEFKTALLSSVSHDMRTPLGAISASASSLSRFGDSLSEETRADLLDTIQEQCDRLNRYTANLLNLGRLQAGVDPELFIDCDVLDALGSAIARARSHGSDHRILKQFGISSALVRGDPVMLEQAFFNVLDNAIRYSPPMSTITVLAIQDGSNLEIQIRDEGRGIPAADLERVFDRFFRSRSEQGQEGSGLGLSIAKGFIEAFGGFIRAERIKDLVGGTNIHITLPLIEREA